MFQQSVEDAKQMYGEILPDRMKYYLRQILPVKKASVLASNLSAEDKASLAANIDSQLAEIAE